MLHNGVNWCLNKLAAQIAKVCRDRLLLAQSANFIICTSAFVSQKYFGEVVLCPLSAAPGGNCSTPSAPILIYVAVVSWSQWRFHAGPGGTGSSKSWLGPKFRRPQIVATGHQI